MQELKIEDDAIVKPEFEELEGFENMVEAPPKELPPVLQEPVKQVPSTVDKHGVVKLSKTRKEKSNLDMSKPYLFPLHDKEGKKTEYAIDQEAIQSSLRMIADGADPKEVYKDNMKLQASTYRNLVEVKGADPRKTAQGLGLDYELIQASTDPWERYKMALDSDVSQIGAGFMNVGAAINQGLGDERAVKIAEEFVAETDAIVKKDKDSQAMYDAFFMEYNEKTGGANSPWNIAAVFGGSTIDAAAGGAITGMVRGTTPAIRALREAYLNVGFAASKESAKAAYHKDPVEFGTGVMSAMFAESVGQSFAKFFLPPVNTGMQTKDTSELMDMMEGLQTLKKYGIEVGEEDLLDPTGVLTRIKAKKHNSAEVERLAKLYTGRNIQLMKGLNKSLQGMGITDARMLNDYAEGVIPLDKMGPQFKEFILDKQAVHKAKMEPVYNSLNDLDVGPSGNQSTYELGGLLNQIADSTSNAKQINQSIKSELRYIMDTLESPASKQAKEVMNGINANLKTEAAKFLKVNADIQKVDDTILTSTNTLGIAKQRLRELGPKANVSTEMQINEAVRKATRDLDKATKARRSLVAQKRESTKQTKRLKQSKKDNKSAFKLVTDPTQASIMQINDLRRHLLALKNSGNTMFDTQSKTHAAAIVRSIKDIDTWLDSVPTDDGKFLVSRLRYANKLAKDGFDKWGDGAFKGIDKALKSDNPDVMNSLFKGENAMFHLKNLGKLAGTDSEIYAKQTAKFLGDKLLKGVKSPSGVKELADVNWAHFSKNINDPEFKSQVKDLLGKEALEQLNGIGYLANTLGKHIDEAFKHIAHTQTQKRHILNTIYSGAAGDALSSIMAGVERYSGKLLKTKFYGGDTSKSGIKASIDNALADMIEVVTGKTIFGVIPNTRYSTGEAIKEVEKELSKRQGNPNAVVSYVKDLLDNSSNMRSGHLKVFPGDTSLTSGAIDTANKTLDSIGQDTQWIAKDLANENIGSAVAKIDEMIEKTVGTDRGKLLLLRKQLGSYADAVNKQPQAKVEFSAANQINREEQ